MGRQGGLYRKDDMKRNAFGACVLAAGLAMGAAGAVDLVLAPDGEVRTPAAALARARALRASGAVAGRPVEIQVAPGRYHLSEPLTFTAADSAVRFRGASPRAAVFDGGRALAPFTAGADGV